MGVEGGVDVASLRVTSSFLRGASLDAAEVTASLLRPFQTAVAIRPPDRAQIQETPVILDVVEMAVPPFEDEAPAVLGVPLGLRLVVSCRLRTGGAVIATVPLSVQDAADARRSSVLIAGVRPVTAPPLRDAGPGIPPVRAVRIDPEPFLIHAEEDRLVLGGVGVPCGVAPSWGEAAVEVGEAAWETSVPDGATVTPLAVIDVDVDAGVLTVPQVPATRPPAETLARISRPDSM